MGDWYIRTFLSFTVVSNLVTWIVTLYVWTFTKNAKEEINDLSHTVEEKLRSFGLTMDNIIEGFKSFDLTKEDIQNMGKTMELFKTISLELQELEVSEEQIKKGIKILKSLQSKEDKKIGWSD